MSRSCQEQRPLTPLLVAINFNRSELSNHKSFSSATFLMRVRCRLGVGIGFFRRLHFKPRSSHFTASPIAIDQFIGVEIVLRNLDAFPSLLEVMGIERVESVILAVVTEDVLRHGADVEV